MEAASQKAVGLRVKCALAFGSRQAPCTDYCTLCLAGDSWERMRSGASRAKGRRCRCGGDGFRDSIAVSRLSTQVAQECFRHTHPKHAEICVGKDPRAAVRSVCNGTGVTSCGRAWFVGPWFNVIEGLTSRSQPNGVIAKDLVWTGRSLPL